MGQNVVHLLGPGRREPHRLYDESELRDGGLYLCGAWWLEEASADPDRLIEIEGTTDSEDHEQQRRA
jgi:hypothetical protein